MSWAILEKAMALHSSTIAWKIPWTEEPGRLQSMGLHRVGYDWSNLAAAAELGYLDDISSSPASPAQQMDSGKEHVVCESCTSTPFIPLHPPIVSGRQDTQSQAWQLEHSSWGTWPWSEPSIWGQDSCLAGLQLARPKVSSCQRSWGIKAKEDCPLKHLALLPPCCLVAREVHSRAAPSPLISSLLNSVAKTISFELCWSSPFSSAPQASGKVCGLRTLCIQALVLPCDHG